MSAPRHRLLLLCVIASACGSPSRPTPPPSVAPPGWSAGTVLTVVSGSDEQPVPGAVVSVAGRTFTADTAGRVTLDTLAADLGLLDVVAAGFYDRQTTVRSSEGTRIALWPKETATGLTQHTTAELVYTAASNCCPTAQLAQYPLHRVSPTIPSFTLVLAPDYRRYPQTVAAVQEAAALASAATEGRVRFVASDAASGPSIEVTAGPDPFNRPMVAAFADRTFNTNGYITGGRVVAVDEDFLTEGWSHVDTVTLLCHELGHMLGLEHSTAPGVMNSSSDVPGAPYLYFRPHRDYSPVEKEVLRIMANRRALNRFPDNDRTATAASSPGDRIVCRR